MILTLKQAAEATGKSKPTILRAIQSHKISATRDEVTQGWLIDAAELHRIYPPVSEKQLRTGQMTNDAAVDETALRREIEVRDQQLEALRQERERERTDKDRQIESLNRRLEAVDEERRTTLRQLTALLTDQSQTRPRPRRWVLPAVLAVVAVLAVLVLLMAFGTPVRSSLP